MPTFGSSIVYVTQALEVSRGDLLITTLYGTYRPTPFKDLRLKLIRFERQGAPVNESVRLAKGDIAYVCGKLGPDQDEDILTVSPLVFIELYFS